MQFLRNMALVFTVTCTASASAASLSYSVPEAQPDAWEYVRVRSWLDAGAAGHAQTSMYQRLPGRQILVESAVVNTSVEPNPLQMPLEINGHRYWIPLQYNGFDNYSKLEYRPRGIYLVQRGFRFNSARGKIDRIDASIRLTGPTGSPLNALEYSEVSRPSGF